MENKNTFDDSSEMFFKNGFLGNVKISNGWHTAFLFRYTTSCNEILSIKRNGIEDYIKVLDVGCGEKTFYTFWFRNFDSSSRPRIDYVGLEYRKDVVDAANKGREESKSVNKYEVIQYDLNVQSLLDINRHEKYDVILLQEILEHVPAETSIKLIQEAKELLTDRGFIVISSPNPKKSEGQTFVWPENHIQEFSLNEMTTIIQNSNLYIRRVNGWLGKANYFKSRLNSEALSLYSEAKKISTGFGTSLISFLYPEVAECYIIIADKQRRLDI